MILYSLLIPFPYHLLLTPPHSMQVHVRLTCGRLAASLQSCWPHTRLSPSSAHTCRSEPPPSCRAYPGSLLQHGMALHKRDCSTSCSWGTAACTCLWRTCTGLDGRFFDNCGLRMEEVCHTEHHTTHQLCDKGCCDAAGRGIN